MRFNATVEPVGRAAGVAIPADVVDSFGTGKRPKVVITINGHTWRSAVTPMGGRFIVGIGAANRAACGVGTGDDVEVELELDAEPRVITEPSELAEALDSDPAARAAFDRLPDGQKRRHVLEIERAKTPETRQRRIAKTITTIRGDHA